MASASFSTDNARRHSKNSGEMFTCFYKVALKRRTSMFSVFRTMALEIDSPVDNRQGGGDRIVDNEVRSAMELSADNLSPN
jgi:hypothetical protein